MDMNPLMLKRTSSFPDNYHIVSIPAVKVGLSSANKRDEFGAIDRQRVMQQTLSPCQGLGTLSLGKLPQEARTEIPMAAAKGGCLEMKDLTSVEALFVKF